MADRTQTHLLSAGNGTATVATPPLTAQRVEADAEALMDDLFGDIDRILAGGSKLPTATAPFASSPQPATGLAAGLTAAPLKMPTSVKSRSNRTPPGKRQPSRSPRVTLSLAYWQLLWRQHMDKILFGLACLALAGVTAGLALQNRLPWQRTLPGLPSETGTMLPRSGDDGRFIGYMLRSLKTIERDRSVAQDSDGSSGQPLASQLPALPNQAPRTIERVYIPVYPPNTNRAATVVPTPTGERSPNGNRTTANSAPASPSPTGSVPNEAPTTAAAPTIGNLQAALPRFEPLPELPSLSQLESPAEDWAVASDGEMGKLQTLLGLVGSRGNRSAAPVLKSRARHSV
ncbi:MAG: hypothetical protein HC838_08750 [Spirulinaceae cyanobacterium RM2_2_10]|nr:hypothetical protein [Spirulinaceae cyanobacterium RM2_2_10]